MAGEWLKFDCTLPEKPETLAITVAMGWDDPDLTVGKLMRLFRWFDQQTLAGNADGVTPALLDRLIGVSGFVQAVAKVGWLVVSDTGIALHNFDKHNGATAKSRAMTAKRVANHRSNGGGNGEGNGPSVTAALAREEKRREEGNTSPNGEVSAPRKRVAQPARPDDVDQQVWTDWLALRKAKRAPVTETVVESANREAQAAGMTLEAFLRVWCARGSQGLQADWLKPNERVTSGPGAMSKPDRIALHNIAVVREFAKGGA